MKERKYVILTSISISASKLDEYEKEEMSVFEADCVASYISSRQSQANDTSENETVQELLERFVSIL